MKENFGVLVFFFHSNVKPMALQYSKWKKNTTHSDELIKKRSTNGSWTQPSRLWSKEGSSDAAGWEGCASKRHKCDLILKSFLKCLD